MNSLDYKTAQRAALGITQMKDLAHALLNPGNATTFEYGTLAEFIDRAPYFTADVPQEAVAVARERLSDAAGRGNAIATRLLADLATGSAS